MPPGMRSGGQPQAALGIDVGGTKVALAVVDRTGRVFGRRRIGAATASPTELLSCIAALANELAESVSPRLCGVGIGVPELVSPAGQIRSCSLYPWSRTDLERELSPLGPLIIEADVRAAALAEARFGAGQRLPAFAYLTLGTGISSTLVLDGEPFAGAHACAQLLGSAPLSFWCPADDGVHRVALEDVASGRALTERYARDQGRAIAGAEDIFAAARRGDASARKLLDEAAVVIGSYVALMINLLDPDAVILGGGFGATRSEFWNAVTAAARSHTWAADARATPVLRAALGPESGVIGAAYLAIRQFGSASRLEPDQGARGGRDSEGEK
jgi:glucokinase